MTADEKTGSPRGWIKLRTDIHSDIAIIKMAKILAGKSKGNPHDMRWAIVGRLTEIWSWIDGQTVTGEGVELEDCDIDARVNCPGFAAAMRAVGWLSGDDGALVFPKWDRYNSHSAKARSLEAEAKRLRRHTKSAQPELPINVGQMSDNVGQNVGQMSGGCPVIVGPRVEKNQNQSRAEYKDDSTNRRACAGEESETESKPDRFSRDISDSSDPLWSDLLRAIGPKEAKFNGAAWLARLHEDRAAMLIALQGYQTNRSNVKNAAAYITLAYTKEHKKAVTIPDIGIPVSAGAVQTDEDEATRRAKFAEVYEAILNNKQATT